MMYSPPSFLGQVSSSLSQNYAQSKRQRALVAKDNLSSEYSSAQQPKLILSDRQLHSFAKTAYFSKVFTYLKSLGGVS